MSDDTEMTRVPDACTLPAAERPMRRAEFDEIFSLAGRVERPSGRHARFHLSGPAELADQVADLAARESLCCSFFTFTVTPAAAGVVFDVEVPAAHVAVLDALVERAGVAAAGR